MTAARRTTDGQVSPALDLRGISKRFGHVRVLSDVSLSLAAGEVLGLLGENGAGKSTLMKIVMGVHGADAGEIVVNGRPRTRSSTQAARAEGLAMVYQDLSLIPQLTVAQNVVLGAERTRAFGPVLRRTAVRTCERVADEFGIVLDPHSTVADLAFGERQLVELAKALNQRPRVLILDEPTASLTVGEQQVLFDILRTVAVKQCGVIFISHRLREVLDATHRIAVLRNGRNAGEVDTADADVPTLVQMMVGADEARERWDLAEANADRSVRGDRKIVLRVQDACTRSKLRDCTMQAEAGEIVGLTGLLGAGRSTLLKALFGLVPLSSGSIEIDGAAYRARSPRAAITRGVALVPEDRAGQGVFGGLSISDNLTSVFTEKIAKWPALGGAAPVLRRRGNELAQARFDALRIKATGIGQPVRQLSGGNQQKAVFAKWTLDRPTLLMCDEPTVGVDVRTKDEIWKVLRDLAAAGTTVLLSSSDLEELSIVCDRVLIMAEGRVVDEVVDGVRDEDHLRLAVQQAAAAARAAT